MFYIWLALKQINTIKWGANILTILLIVLNCIMKRSWFRHAVYNKTNMQLRTLHGDIDASSHCSCSSVLGCLRAPTAYAAAPAWTAAVGAAGGGSRSQESSAPGASTRVMGAARKEPHPWCMWRRGPCATTTLPRLPPHHRSTAETWGCVAASH
jgi:hypothetical protein